MSAYIRIVYECIEPASHGNFSYSINQLMKLLETHDLKYVYFLMPDLGPVQTYSIKVVGDKAFNVLKEHSSIFVGQSVEFDIFPALDSDQNPNFHSKSIEIEEYKKTGCNPWGLYNIGFKLTHKPTGYVVKSDMYRQRIKNLKEAKDMMYSYIKHAIVSNA